MKFKIQFFKGDLDLIRISLDGNVVNHFWISYSLIETWLK